MLGTKLSGRYKIVKHLGGGGFGQTYLAEDLQLPGNPICVVKQLKPKSTDPTTFEIARRLFDREAQVLYKLGNYDQIPRLLAHFEEQQEFYLVQEFIEGDELKREMPFGKPLSEIQVIAICRDILKILEFVHQQDVIHRDIKPSNIIRRKQDGKLVLIDFGAVKQVSTQTASLQQPSKDTTLTVSIGSPGYMPNEQLAGKPQFSSDIYAVGMLGLQALSGLPPHQLPADPKTSEILWREKLLQSTLHKQVKISPELADVLDTMVRYDYRQRYESATEALQALEQLTNPNPCQSNLPTSEVTQTALASTPPATATYSVSPQVPSSQLDSTVAPTQSPPTATYSVPLQVPSSQLDSTVASTQAPSSEPQTVSGSPFAHSQSQVTPSRKKSPWLIRIGVGFVTAVTLGIGIYFFQETRTSLAQKEWVENIAVAKTLPTHSTQINSVAISPDSKILAGGGEDGIISLWDLKTGQLKNPLKGHSSAIYALAWSQDGQILASGSADETIKLWSLNSDKQPRTLSGNSAGISTLAISPDGQTLVSGDRIGTLKIWNLSKRELIDSFPGHNITVTSLAISPDSQTLASSSQDNTIKLWKLKTGELLHTFTSPYSHHFFSVAISPDGTKIAGGSWEGSIHLWDLKGGKLLKTLKKSANPVNSIVFNPTQENLLVSNSADGTIQLWNIQTGEPLSTLAKHTDDVNSLAVSADGQTLVSSSQDKTIKIWRSSSEP